MLKQTSMKKKNKNHDGHKIFHIALHECLFFLRCGFRHLIGRDLLKIVLSRSVLLRPGLVQANHLHNMVAEFRCSSVLGFRFQISGVQVWMSRCPNVWVSRCLGVQVSKCSSVQTHMTHTPQTHMTAHTHTQHTQHTQHTHGHWIDFFRSSCECDLEFAKVTRKGAEPRWRFGAQNRENTSFGPTWRTLVGTSNFRGFKFGHREQEHVGGTSSQAKSSP